MMKPLLSLALIFACLASTAHAQQALTTGADFLLMTTGARPDAMGQAFSAVADDVNTLTFNPAGLGNIRQPEVGYGHESFVSNINYDFVGGAFPLGGWGVLGFGYINMGSGLFNSTANPNATSTSVDDQAFILGWGKSFYNLHVGLAVKYITEQIDTVTGSGFAFDLGLRYRILPQLTVAASALNIGSGIQLVSNEPLPTVVDAGIAFSPVDEKNHKLTLSSDAIYNIATNDQKLGFGGEYWFQNTFALRAGYLFNNIDPTDTGFSAGAGVQFAFFQLDYALEPFSTQGIVNRFSGILRWDGPWVPGGEPNAPQFVTVEETDKTLKVRWTAPRGHVMAYEVVIQPLDGSSPFISAPVTELNYEFKKYLPDTLYKVSVRSVGEGGGRSFLAKEAFIDTGELTFAREPQYGEKGEGVTKTSVTNGVNGKLDVVGLQLSWEAPKDFTPEGYNLYRKSNQGLTEKITSSPKHRNQLWIADITRLQGSEFIVTALDANGKEKQIGSFIWYPAVADLVAFNNAPILKLAGEPEPSQGIYLDWDKDTIADNYLLLVDPHGDGIYEAYKAVDRPEAGKSPTVLLKMEGKNPAYSFIVVSRDENRAWLKRSNEVRVEMQ